MTARSGSASDIRKDHWLFRLLPAGAHPYLTMIRADRPIGTWLLLIPCLWALAMPAAAAGAWPDAHLLLLFVIGAFVMRGAGCVVNDIADRKIDALVARTASRPLPSGAIRLKQALLFLLCLLLLGLLILLQLSATAIILGVASLLLVGTYPLMKRITYWPQAFLGLTFNWGALMGWAAATDELAWPALLLYLGGLFWTLGYDTIYAHQDREDDLLVGVKSTAIRLSRSTRPWLAVFYGLAILCWLAATATAGLAWPAYLGLAAAAAHFAWQLSRLDIDNPPLCLALFKSNKWAGLGLFAGILASVPAA